MALRSPVVRAAPAAVLVIAAAAAALTARPQDAPPPTFKSEANYIRVDVYPTLTGAPVTDLRREEFEVSDENVVQTIDAVEHVTIRAASQDLGRAGCWRMAAPVFVIFLDTVTLKSTHRTTSASRWSTAIA